MRELFNPEQIEVLFGSKASTWLTGDITPDREPEIRTYLMQELGITEVTPATLVPRLTKAFLEDQSDEWVLRLYEFLSGQEAALRRRLDTIPLIRLDDGTHVVTHENGAAKAFLPSTIKTGFPTIRRTVCATPEARSFLISLGITEPDPVDDVIWNLMPKYQENEVDVADDAYADDIERIGTAFSTDSKTQREKLLAALRETSFVMVVDTGDGKGYVAKPGGIYIATDRLKQLFAGVPDILIVDNEYDCLRGEDTRPGRRRRCNGRHWAWRSGRDWHRDITRWLRRPLWRRRQGWRNQRRRSGKANARLGWRQTVHFLPRHSSR